MVFNIACFVESAILESLEPPPDGEAGQARAPDLPNALVLAGRTQKHQMWRAARLRHKLNICPVKINDRARRILNYFFCLRRSFSTETTVHVAFDASRVGGRNRLLGFISRPDGLGAWLPPQALSSRRNFQGTQRFYSSSGFFPKTGVHKDVLDVFGGLHKDLCREFVVHKDFFRRPRVGTEAVLECLNTRWHTKIFGSCNP